MRRSSFFLMVGAVVIVFLAIVSGCAKIPVRGTPPQYTGLSRTPEEAENPNSIVKVVIPTSGSKDKEQIRDQNSGLPVITSAYAIDRAKYGTILKIYIEAENSRGDMARIATSVDQVGFGHYPTDFIILNPQYGKYFKGYIQWNTFSSKTSYMDDGTRMYVRVAVIDKAGLMSNTFEFPFTFDTGVGPAPNPPAPFDQGDLPRLGNISIDLSNPRLRRP